MAQSLPLTKAQRKQPPGEQVSELESLEKAWRNRASTVYYKTWVKVTPQHRQVLRNTVHGWKDKALTKPGKGGSLRTLKKNEALAGHVPSQEAELLKLRSKQNDLAANIKHHILREYDATLIRGAKVDGPLASLASVLNCIDNKPDWVKLDDLKWNLIIFLVTECDKVLEECDRLLNFSKRSYKEIVLDLIASKEMYNASLFFIGALRLMLNYPILVVLPDVQKDNSVSSGQDVTFSKRFLIDADTFLAPSEFRICLVFNGYDYFCPFIQKDIARIISAGRPVITKVHECFEALTDLVADIPASVSLKTGLGIALQHVEAAKVTCDSMNFTIGTSTTKHPLNMAPLPEPTSDFPRKRRRTSTSTAAETSTAAPDAAEVDVAEIEETEEERKEREEEERRVREEEALYIKLRPDCKMKDNQCVCGKVFDSYKDVKHHIVGQHSQTWGCSVCPKTIKSQDNLWKHYRSIHEHRWTFYCDVNSCTLGPENTLYGSDEQFSTMKHEHDQHGIIHKEIQCPKCHHSYGKKKQLEEHISKCQNTENPYKCDRPKCNKSYRKKESLKYHLRTDHTEAGDKSGFYKCPICGKDTIKTDSGYRSHLDRHRKRAQAAEAAKAPGKPSKKKQEDSLNEKGF